LEVALEATLSWLEKHYQIEIPRGNYTCGSSLHNLVSKHLPPNSPQIDEYELYELIGKEFLASMECHNNILPLEYSQEVVRILSQDYTLHVATARLTLGRDVVKTMLDNFFPDCISSIHHVWHIEEDGKFYATTKKTFIDRLKNPLFFIDDSPREIEEVFGSVKTILLDPENHHTNMTGMNHRVNTWEQILDITGN